MCPVSTYNTKYNKNTQSTFLTLQNYKNYSLSIILIVNLKIIRLFSTSYLLSHFDRSINKYTFVTKDCQNVGNVIFVSLLEMFYTFHWLYYFIFTFMSICCSLCFNEMSSLTLSYIIKFWYVFYVKVWFNWLGRSSTFIVPNLSQNTGY